MKSNYHTQIKENTKEIVRLHKRIHENFRVKNKEDEWKSACKEYHERFNELCYWNGIYDYRAEIRAGNLDATEHAICFIEIRPYFPNSGYIFKDLMRVLKSIELNTDQQARFERVNTRYLDFLKENGLKKK
jgi:hypothetical protein